MALFLLIVLVAVGLGIVGVVVHGLLWLLAVAIVVFVLNFGLAGAGLRGGRRRRITR
jgi:hypothetical protein